MLLHQKFTRVFALLLLCIDKSIQQGCCLINVVSHIKYCTHHTFWSMNNNWSLKTTQF